jgi:cytochrome b561
MPPWEKFAARSVHVILYALMLTMPLVGWMIISTLPHNALFFGQFTIPNLPFLHDLPNKKEVREILETIHGSLALTILSFFVLHAGAALKHHFIDRDDVLLHMAPGFLGGLLIKCRNIFTRGRTEPTAIQPHFPISPTSDAAQSSAQYH